MDFRSFLLVAWVSGGLVSPAAAEHGTDPAQVHLALAEVHAVPQPAPQVAATGSRVVALFEVPRQINRPELSFGGRAVRAGISRHADVIPHGIRRKLEPIPATPRATHDQPMDGVQVGYEQLFSPRARHRDVPEQATEAPSASSGRETKILTVFSGADGREGQARTARGLQAPFAQELLVALRAGF